MTMKKKYTSPKLITIGDMTNNTLGASGTRSDGASMQAGAYNNAQTNDFNNRNFGSGGFNNKPFGK